ncbi:MAG TPA: ABC transporter permease [Terriglobales bacterium]|nr:ABC transporter permease [Terriglobales bacterium]
MTGLLQDIRYALRQLRKSPGFTAVAIVSLGLGIGANTAIFTLINQLVLKSLPVRDPQHLVSFGKAVDGGEVDGIGPGPLDIFPYDFYKQIERTHDPFLEISASGSFPVTVSVRNRPKDAATQALTQLVSGTFFQVLGVESALGRTILPDDADAPGRNSVAVVSYRYWEEKLEADRSVIGRVITINGTSFTVIGVAPPAFFGAELNEQEPDMWLPITMQQQVTLQPSLLNPHGLFWVHMMGRLKEGTTPNQGQAWATQQLQQFMITREGGTISDKRRREIGQMYIDMLPGGRGVSHLREQFSRPLYILMGVVVLVLAIACANLANFLLAKAAAREREISTRLAIGAGRWRLVRQILTEALLLSLLGSVAGLTLALVGTRMLVDFVVQGAKNSALTPNPDLTVLAFTLAVSVATGALFGIAPAWRASQMRVVTALHSARTATGSGIRSRRMLPNLLIAAQVALSLVLLVGAGLFLRTLQNLRNQNLGFNRRNLLLVDFNAKLGGYKSEQLRGLYDRLLNGIRTLPGVRSASISGTQPISPGSWTSPIFVQGYTPAPNENIMTFLNRVSPSYLDTVGIPVLQGRSIGREDTPTSMKAVLINQSVAKHFFPHGDAIGHQFTIADPSVPGVWRIVGIVGDAKYGPLRDEQKRMIYLPLEQLTADDHFAYSIQVRAEGDPKNIESEIRTALAEVDPDLPLLKVRTISQEVDSFVENERLISQLANFFSLLALSLACIGLYGVLTYNVVKRTNEIGIRMALGARTEGILWMVLRESLLLLAAGIAVGIPATVGVARIVRSQLFGLSSFDAATFMTAIGAIAIVILIAAYLPARRAAKVDPMVALRYE